MACTLSASVQNNTLKACNSGSIEAGTVDNGPENVFRYHLITYAVRTENFNIFHYFFAKIRKIPYFRSVKLQSAITPVL